MKNGKLRVGMIGVGGISVAQHLPHWQTCPHAEVVAMADSHAEGLTLAARTFGVDRTFQDWRQLVDQPDLDIIDIATPNRLHTPMALAALESGKHVLCEKPMATTAAEAEQMLNASRRAGKLLMINHVFRFGRSIEQLRAMTANGELGDIYYVRALWNRRRMVPPRPTFITKALSAGGPLLDIGVHMLDLACWFLDFPKIERVTGTLGRFLAGQPGMSGEWGDWNPEEYDVEDFASTMVQFEGGATLSLEVSWLLFQQEPETRALHVFGNRGGLHWPDNVLCHERDKIPYDTQLLTSASDSPFRESIHRFAAAVVAEEPSPIPPEQTVQVMRILDALYQSSAERREIRL